MRRIMLAAVFILVLAHSGSADTARCTTREDPQFKRWVTTCTDGSRAVTKYDIGLQRWQTDITKAPTGDKAPRGWLTPVQGSR